MEHSRERVDEDEVVDIDPNNGIVRLADGREVPIGNIEVIGGVAFGHEVQTTRDTEV